MFTKLPPALSIQEANIVYEVDVIKEDFFKAVYKNGGDELVSFETVYPARDRILLLARLQGCKESRTSDFRKIRFCYEASDRAVRRVLQYLQNLSEKTKIRRTDKT